MNRTLQTKPITQQWGYITTSWALATLYNPFAQVAIGCAFWTVTIAYICLADSAMPVVADCLNLLFFPWNIVADLTGLPRAPHLTP